LPRAIDIARVQDFKRYAILIVVDIDKTATAFVSEQFRIWTLSRPQTTSITIETAVWSLFRTNRRDALDPRLQRSFLSILCVVTGHCTCLCHGALYMLVRDIVPYMGN
jgi:hypothetical protein